MSLWDDDYVPILPNWEKEIWLLDPGPFIDIAFDMGMSNFVFRSQYAEAHTVKQDFTKFIDVFSRGREWKVIWIPYPGNFCVLFTDVKGWDDPVAVWQIWRATENKLRDLDEMFWNPLPVGKVVGGFGPKSRVDVVEVAPVKGQPHRVVLANAPSNDADWGKIATFAQRLQAEDPKSTLHFHGQKSVGRTIGVAAKSFDHPVRIGWYSGHPRILLPNGMGWDMGVKPSKFQKDWLRIIGVDDKALLKIKKREVLSREVYRINLLSLRWAFLNWDRAWDFRRIAGDTEDIDSADLDWEPASLPVRLRKTKGERMELDRWLCNTCSLQFRCPYSREGAVCIVPDSEPVELAEHFQTRSSASIIEGLATILQANSRRATRGMRAEEEACEKLEEAGDKFATGLSPEVTRILNSVFDRGVQLAKLVDPGIAARLAPQTKILNIGSVTTSGVLGPTTNQELMNGVIAELDARGITLADATPALIDSILAESTQPAIEAKVQET